MTVTVIGGARREGLIREGEEKKGQFIVSAYWTFLLGKGGVACRWRNSQFRLHLSFLSDPNYSVSLCMAALFEKDKD